MKKKAIIFNLILSLFCNCAAFADQHTNDEIQKLKVPTVGQSVYELSFWTDLSLIISGVGISMGANSLDYNLIWKKCPCNVSEVNGLDQPAIYYDNKSADVIANYLVTLSLLAPIAIDYFDVGISKEFVEDMAVYAEVVSVNLGLVTLAKYGFQRPYPYMYRGDAAGAKDDPSNYLSFYSGHTTTTVSSLAAAAMTLNLRHHHVIWPWIVTAVTGTFIGAELVYSGEHFTTDVIVGAGMGLLVGTFVPGLHARDHRWTDYISYMPMQNGGGLQWQKTF